MFSPILSDHWVRFWRRWTYALGTWKARRLLRHVGARAALHPAIHYWQPSKIWIGDAVEIRHQVTLDARSTAEIGIRIGDRSRIKDHVALMAYGGTITIGQQVLIGRGSTLFGHGGITIGDDAMFGPQVTLVSTNHIATLDGRPFQDQGFTREPIIIENNVWLGAQVVVLAGAYIPPHTVVAAGSVVRGALPHAGWLYAGNPARPIKPLPAQPPHDTRIYFRNWGLHE